MIIYSKLDLSRVEDFWALLNRLDTETDYMMYEPDERKEKTSVQELASDIEANVIQIVIIKVRTTKLIIIFNKPCFFQINFQFHLNSRHLLLPFRHSLKRLHHQYAYQVLLKQSSVRLEMLSFPNHYSKR